jgi:hypothetical protein
MSKPIIEIIDAETNEVTRREMNNAEYAQALKDKAEAEAKIAEQAEAEAKRAALLERLGITADEAKLLLG